MTVLTLSLAYLFGYSLTVGLLPQEGELLVPSYRDASQFRHLRFTLGTLQ